MLIYHGGYLEIINPEIKTSKTNKDFRNGFYCTTIQSQAERWAMRFDKSIVSVYEYNLNNQLKILLFPEMTEEWLDFIVNCRNGKIHDYDIISGAMANDQVWNYVADFINGVLTWILAKFKHPTHQITFCSDKSLQSIKFVKSFEVKQ